MNDFQVGDLVLVPSGFIGAIKEIDYTHAPVRYKITIVFEKDQKTPCNSRNDLFYYGLQLRPWAPSKEVLNLGQIVKNFWYNLTDEIRIIKYQKQFYWVVLIKGEIMEYYQLR